MSVTSETYAVAICPKCKKIVVLPRIYAPAGHRNIRYVAVKHYDHAFIVGFDRFGVIRTTHSYDFIKEIGSSVGKEKCPKCGNPVPIKTNFMKPYAIDHGEHIIVVFPIGEKAVIEVYDVITPLRMFPKPSIIKKVVREIGRDRLAYIFYEAYVKKKREFIIPPSVQDEIKRILKDVFGTSIKARSGPLVLRPAPEAKYFERAIEKVEDITYLEAIHLLRDAVEVLDGLYDSLQKIKKIHGFKQFCEELKRVKEGDPLAYEILKTMFPIKCKD